MKKIFTFVVALAFAAGANATPYKALYVEADAQPVAAGTVYLAPKSTEDETYVFDISEEEGSTAFIKWVGGENSNGEGYPGCTGGIGMYEVLAYAFPEDGYEFVCFANKVKDDGVYTKDDCYAVIHSENASGGWTFDFDYTGYDQGGVKISVNNPNHPEDGHSDKDTGKPSRDDVYANYESYGTVTPDTYVYAIFRKIGDELPKFDSEETGIKGIDANVNDNVNDNRVYNLAGQRVGSDFKGIVVVGGKKYIKK